MMDYQLDAQVKALMKDAEKEAKEMGNSYIGSEHVLLAIMHNSTTSLAKELQKKGLYYDKLKQDLQVLFGVAKPYVDDVKQTQVVDEILEKSMQLANNRNESKVDVETLIEALLHTEDCVATEMLHRYDIDEEALLQQVQQLGFRVLDNCQELRNMNESGKDIQVIGREKELQMMSAVLARKEKANPLLVGEAGVGKSALVEKLAYMLEHEQLPSLQGCKIYELNLNALVAGTRYRGDFEEKLQNLMELLEQFPNVILFIDEIHQMIGAGKSEGSIDVASVLKPYLARSAIRCIGATTLDEYERYIEKDRALERRFHVIELKEPTTEETLAMLQGKQQVYEHFHDVQIEEESFQTLLCNCVRYMSNRKFPDKAFDVLDLACVEAKNQHNVVTSAIISQVVEAMTGIPMKDEKQLQEMKEKLSTCLIFQEKIVDKLIRQLYWIKQGITSQRPLGVWLFYGKEGSGKMSLIKEFHTNYFPGKKMIEVDLLLGNEQLEHVIFLLRRTPNTTVCIRNVQKAKASQLLFWQQAIEKGELHYGTTKADLRHSIVIFHADDSEAGVTNKYFQVSKAMSLQLPKDFLEVFDEIFSFRNLNIDEKVCIASKLLNNWKVRLEDEKVKEIVEATTTMSELKLQLKNCVLDKICIS